MSETGKTKSTKWTSNKNLNLRSGMESSTVAKKEKKHSDLLTFHDILHLAGFL